MDRKSFASVVEAAPISDNTTRFVANPNLLKTYDDAKARERGGYSIKVRLLPVDINAKVQSIPETAYHTWGTGKTFRKVRCTGDKFKCPICRENWEHHVKGDEHDKDVSMMKIDRFINCYVISNPADPDSVGKVKILKMPSTIYGLYVQATTGDRVDEFGIGRVISIDEGGVTLVIKVVNQNNRVSYEGSYFMSEHASRKDVEGLSDEQKDEIWNAAFDIKKELADDFAPVDEDAIIKTYIEQYSVPRNVEPLTPRVLAVWKDTAVAPETEEEREEIEGNESEEDDEPEERPAKVTKSDKVSKAVAKASSDIDDILS